MLLASMFVLSLQGWTPYSPLGLEDERANVILSYRQLLEANDDDRDGKWSRLEWMAMVDISYPEQRRPGEGGDDYSEVRAQVIGYHHRLDSDRDGLVTVDELIREPMASFDCIDGDGNQQLSLAEIESAMARCPGPVRARVGFISAPPPEAAPGR